jgi:hypothetical protein
LLHSHSRAIGAGQRAYARWFKMSHFELEWLYLDMQVKNFVQSSQDFHVDPRKLVDYLTCFPGAVSV